MTRRELLRAALAVPLLQPERSRGLQPEQNRGLHPSNQSAANRPDRTVLGFLHDAPSRIVPIADADVTQVELSWDWSGVRPRLTNHGRAAVHVKEVVLFDATLPMPPSTGIYGEGFQMLSQTGGTLGEPKDLGMYTDAKHYRMPMPEGTRSMYGAIRFSEGSPSEIAFTSCRRFSGVFRLRGASSLQVVVDTEGLPLAPGDTWDLEALQIGRRTGQDTPFTDLAGAIASNHPFLEVPAPPTGWCSWYCFGAKVTAQQVLDNLDVIAKKIPDLKYVQIDDGYQPAMGDWLETGAAFGGDVRRVLDEIRTRGFQPAIWVAPFIAEEQSHVFQQHRDWFVQDQAGAPLRSDTVTFGGWRRGPWYVLDGTHPDVQAHLVDVFRTMREQWGCTYFKLDANVWGAIHGGRFHDPKATRIEAYRRGMQAILRGAGDSFILGCNHPIWPSFGLIHGSRSSNDIKRSWDRVKSTARENLMRNWQNGRLWWNDPDAVCLTGDLTDDEFQCHATAIVASGGMVLSGDDLTTIPDRRLAMLKKMAPPTGKAAVFADDSLTIGSIDLTPQRSMRCLFNWDDQPRTLTTRVTGSRVVVTDFWTGDAIPVRDGAVTLTDMAPHSARLLVFAHA
jgi:alpha-galactosidase